MRYVALIGGLAILLFMAACGDGNSIPASTAIPGSSAPTNQPQGMPTTTPSPQPPGSITPVPASESYRLDLGVGVVVSFVEGLSPEMPDKVAYVTHVPSGSQAVLDRDGQIIDRHDGRDDGPRRLDAVLQDRAAMRRIVEGLKNDEDVRPRETLAEWAHSVQFGGITYLAKGGWFGPMLANGERAMTADDLGPELYRVAFRGDGYVGSYRYQDGDATYLNPGTPVYAVKGYVPEFRLATLEEGRVTLFEADTNPLATTGEDLLGIRGKVTAVRILSTDYARTVLGTIDEESQVERFVELVLQPPVDQGTSRPRRAALLPRLPARRRYVGRAVVLAGVGRTLARDHDGSHCGVYRVELTAERPRDGSADTSNCEEPISHRNAHSHANAHARTGSP